MSKFFKNKNNENCKKKPLLTVEFAQCFSKYLVYNISDAKKTFKETRNEKKAILEKTFMDLDEAIKKQGISSFETEICFELDLEPVKNKDGSSGYKYVLKDNFRHYFNKQAFRNRPSFSSLSLKYALENLTIKDFYDEFIERGFQVKLKRIEDNLCYLVLSGWSEKND
jgi:hypothetical protein